MRENTKLRTAVADTIWKSGLLGLAVYDTHQHTLRDANGAFLDLLDSRYRTKKTLGAPLEQCLPEIDAAGLQAALQQCVRQAVPVHLDALRLHPANGGTTWVNCLLLPMAAEDGEVKAEIPLVVMVASERKTDLPSGESLNLVDVHTRQALARQFRLSAREMDIVAECLRGKKNRDIAADLHIGISTVKRHLESAYRKMGISSSRSLPLAILNVLRTLAPDPGPLTAGASLSVMPASEPAPQAESQAA